MKTHTSIELHLENLEAIEFPMEDVVDLRIGKIQTQISKDLPEIQIAKHFEIHVSKEADVTQSFMSSWNDEEKESPFKRLAMYDDITSIDLIKSDGTKREIYVNWDSSEDNDCDNEYQSSVISESNGDLFIVISKKHNVNDIYGTDVTAKEPFYRTMRNLSKCDE